MQAQGAWATSGSWQNTSGAKGKPHLCMCCGPHRPSLRDERLLSHHSHACFSLPFVPSNALLSPPMSHPTPRHMVLAPWADEDEVEEDVKKRSATADAMGAKTLCLPFQQPDLPEGTTCFASGKPAKNWALWGRSY